MASEIIYPVELQMYLDLIPNKEIAKVMGINERYMSAKLTKMRKKYGIERRVIDCNNSNNVEFVKDKELVLELVAGGMSITDIVSKWEIDYRTCQRVLGLWGCKPRKNNRISVAHFSKNFGGVFGEMIITHGGEDLFKVVRI